MCFQSISNSFTVHRVSAFCPSVLSSAVILWDIRVGLCVLICPTEHLYVCDYDYYYHFMCPGVLIWVSGPLELELQTVVSCHVDAGN